MRFRSDLFPVTTVLALSTMAGLSAANLSGSGTITYHDYRAIPLDLLKYNPPSCGMPYAELDLDRITAVQQMNTATDCGQCIKITNTNDPSKFVYALAVDTGGRGLDLSKGSFGKLFNIDDGVGPASWAPADNSNCVGAWSKLGSGPYDGSTVPAPAPEDPKPVQPAPSSSSSSSSPAPPVVSTIPSVHSTSNIATAPPAIWSSIVVPPVHLSVHVSSVLSHGSATVRSLSSGTAVGSTISLQAAVQPATVDKTTTGTVSEQISDAEQAVVPQPVGEKEEVAGVGHNAQD
ncbi:hypothetical protein LPJ75_007077, partial [Coemansia sp. RSA 2598]